MAKAKETKLIPISQLRPYEKNAKIHTPEQLEMLVKSIREFGFVSPVLIDEDKNIIAGHGRVEAATLAGLEEIPCTFVEGLTEEQRRAYILADNRISEFGEWDMELVNQEIGELADLDFEIDMTGFDLPEAPSIEDHDYYGDERERTFSAYNLRIALTLEKTKDFWQMPVIKNDGVIPSRLIGFNYALNSKDKKAGIHCFIDDYQFERLWRSPEKYVSVLKEYEVFLSPDFSLYLEMDMSTKIYNVYRSRLIGAYYQQQGIKIIPTISWAEPETFEFCFKGIPKGSTVAVSTIGVKEDENALKAWKAGMDAMMKAIRPKEIIVYGGALEYDYGNAKVHYFANEVTEDWS